LIIGGAGAFGSQIARLLAQTPGFELVLGGRGRPRTEAVATELRGSFPQANVSALFVDRDAGLAELLAENAFDIVIDAAGPFQGHDYRVAQAALQAGAHYLDLADARDFVQGFDRLDAIARRANKVAISGASSVPAISSAAVGALAEGLTVIEIRLGITPGAGVPWGRSVAAAVLSQIGKASQRRVAGEWRRVFGWQDLRRRTLQVRKSKAMHRWLSHCDVPDLDGLARRYPSADTVTFHAGIEPSSMHLGLWALSWLVRWGRVRDLSRYTDRLLGLARRLSGHRPRPGGMFAEIVGFDDQGRWLRRVWTLYAPPGRGPVIPAIPAALLVQALARDELPPGARGAYETVPLQALENMFDRFGITTQRSETAMPAPLLEHALGAELAVLPGPIRKLHQGHVPLVLEGEARVRSGSHPAAPFVRRLFGFPDDSQSVPVRVEITPSGSRERWSRKFAERRFRSTLKAIGAAGSRRVAERFGPFSFDMRLAPDESRLVYELTQVRFLGTPLPRFLAPRVAAEERVEDARFIFDVRIELYQLGLLVHYSGWLLPVQNAGPSQAASPQAPLRENLADPAWPF
jgi:hypothetical protein